MKIPLKGLLTTWFIWFILNPNSTIAMDTKVMKEKTTITKSIEGNYEMNIDIAGVRPADSVQVFFSATGNRSKYAFVEIKYGEYRIGRYWEGKTDIWKKYQGITSLPWKVRILKKGNYYRFWVNGVEGDMRSPMGEWEDIFEPWTAEIGVKVPAGVLIKSFTVTTLPWLDQRGKKLWEDGPEGSWYEWGSIPGAIIEYKGKYYMYFLAHRSGGKFEGEGKALRSIGGAYSDDLINWKIHPEPLITTDKLPGDNIYPNAALVLPDGKIALLFSVQKFPEWLGFFLATADSPLGPFQFYEKNPVYKHFSHAHEFDVVEINHPVYKYLMMYSGFTPNPPSGPPGDRGYALYSNDLINWSEHPQNPVFYPETLTGWDCTHIRPRGLNKIDDTWYLWYEGCVNWQPPKEHHGWWDTVGLARSRDLLHWDFYPRNPALPGLGISKDQFDNTWVGWPRMVIKDGLGYVFYSGPGLRTIEINKLVDWETEGGMTIDVLQEREHSGK